jgi:hypothetical protein
MGAVAPLCLSLQAVLSLVPCSLVMLVIALEENGQS